MFPKDVIEPYDLTLNNMKTAEIEDWSEKVLNQMQSRLDLNEIDTVFFHTRSLVTTSARAAPILRMQVRD